MPITQSAKKALRGSLRKRRFNLARKKAVTDSVKSFKKLVSEKKKKEAEGKLKELQQILDKGAKRGIMKKGTAARKKSRFAKMVKNIA